MPRQISLPIEPRIVFGVFNRYGRQPQPGESSTKFSTGWRVDPNYGFAISIVSPTRDELRLDDHIETWKRRVLAAKQQSITMSEVLVDRVISSVRVDSWAAAEVTFADGSFVRLRATRGHDLQVEGPTTSPLIIRRILADQRTFRLVDGGTLLFSRKMELNVPTVPIWILDQVFGP